ncbi:MAG: thioesterase family protein [Thermoanaerobaculia bacterium]|nr:thioesterase family protein [Thermoanaerobaculia bacterium]
MAFRARLDVRFGDIDHAGIVYYPRFLHYFHVALEEFFRDHLGRPYHRFLDEEQVGLPTVHLEIDFRNPLRFGDEIEVEVGVHEIGRTSIDWTYRVFKPEDLLAAEARIVTVALDMESFEKTPVPDWLRRALEEYRREEDP